MCARSVLWAEAQNCDNLRLLAISRGYVELQCVMAARSAKTLPSDPEYLLSLMSQIGDDSESDDKFDGWLDDDHRERDDETGPALPCRRHHQGLGLTAEFAVIGK